MAIEIPKVEPRPERLKLCTGACGEWWPIGCFSRDPTNKDGRRNVCNDCRQKRRVELRNGAPRRKPWDWKKGRT